MTNTKQTKTVDDLAHFKNKGARKGELYTYYKPLSRAMVYAEILDILTTERGLTVEAAKREFTLKGSEVALLDERLR